MEGKHNNQINVKWEQGSISTLGIELCNTEKEMIDKTVRPKVKAMKSLLNVWSQRGFSLKGKITVINSLVIPKILYVASVIPIPAQIIYNIEKMLANFIWSGRRPKIKNSTLIAALEDGGLKLVDLHSKIKATYITWIQRCLKGSVHPIVSKLLLYYFKFNDSITLFNSGFEIRKKSDLPTFYQDFYKAWSQIKHKNLLDSFSIRHKIIWLNKCKTINGKPLNWALWKNCRIKYINDIVNDKGRFLTQDELSIRLS